MRLPVADCVELPGEPDRKRTAATGEKRELVEAVVGVRLVVRWIERCRTARGIAVAVIRIDEAVQIDCRRSCHSHPALISHSAESVKAGVLVTGRSRRGCGVDQGERGVHLGMRPLNDCAGPEVADD